MCEREEEDVFISVRDLDKELQVQRIGSSQTYMHEEKLV